MRARALLPIVAAGALVSAEAPAADPACPYGVNAHQASNAALDQAAAAGVSWVRFDMNWFQFEPSDDSYNWTEADRFIGHATDLGLEVFVTVAYTPMWAVGVPCNDADPNPVNWCRNAVPANPSDYTDFLTAAMARYPQVTHWGMWNEPNLEHFFKGTRTDYVNSILVPGSNAVHAACPSCKVLGPELANLRGSANWDANEGTCIGNDCIFNGWNHSLKKVLEVAGGSIDIITHHKYADPAGLWWSELLDGTVEVIKVADGVKEITDALAPNKPVWITELGWESEPYGPHSNTYAASQLTEIFEGLPKVKAGTLAGATNQPWPELEKLFWYDLHDDPNGYSWGLMTSDLMPKAPYNAYQQVIASQGSCTPDPGSGGGGAASTSSSTTAGAGGATAGVGGAGAGAATSTTGSGSGGGPQGGDPPGDEGGCSCRTAGRTPDRSAWLLLGLGLLLGRRRRGVATVK